MIAARALFVFVCLAAPVIHAGDDLKIVGRDWTTGDVNSSTIYVKGDLLRVDNCWGERGACATPGDGSSVSHCGSWSALRMKHRWYYTKTDGSGRSISSLRSMTAQETAASHPGLVRVVVETVDTGERKTMFGYTARHILATTKVDLSRSTCPAYETGARYDGWYIDPPYKNKCSETEPDLLKTEFDRISLCDDKVIVEWKGPVLGLALTESEEHARSDGKDLAGYTVTSISHEDLDPALFAKPDARPISELSRRGQLRRPRICGSQPNAR